MFDRDKKVEKRGGGKEIGARSLTMATVAAALITIQVRVLPSSELFSEQRLSMGDSGLTSRESCRTASPFSMAKR